MNASGLIKLLVTPVQWIFWFLYQIGLTREAMSQPQISFFVKIKNVIMSDFIPLFEDTVSNILSLRCDKISRLHQALLLFQSLIDNKWISQKNVIWLLFYQHLNNNNTNTRQVQRSTQRNTAYPNRSMLCLCSLFVLSWAKIIIDLCMKTLYLSWLNKSIYVSIYKC